MEVLVKAAAEQAEWDFHNSIMAMKKCVRSLYGADSNKTQSIGYKQKSERKRPRRKVAEES
jgi:hypothetical protein